MTTLEYNQIKENFKPAKTVDEVLKIQNDISEITWILSTIPFNTETARQKIESINREHPNNYLFYFLLNPTNGNSTPVFNAPSESLRQDLAWKKTYLEIKADAKTLDEVIHQLESLCNHSL
ncbi:MAG: hypothetical protein HDR09_16260 [Lachnospiraceae bacterium]|nr:hypothetical protein [Lachnospiraceae bacterium]